jgi:hypothetical protein
MKNKQTWMVVAAFLMSLSNVLSQEIGALIQKGQVKPTDSELYVRKAVGNGTSDLLAGIPIAEVGITNFDGNKLEANRYFVADAITLNYGVAASGTSASNVNYTTALPPALKAANLIFRQNGEVVFKLPIAAIEQAKNTDARYRELGGFQLLRDKVATKIEIEMPDGADLNPGVDNTGYVEVLIKGFETYIKQ